MLRIESLTPFAALIGVALAACNALEPVPPRTLPPPAAAPAPVAAFSAMAAATSQVPLCDQAKDGTPAGRSAFLGAIGAIPDSSFREELRSLGGCAGARGLAATLSATRAGVPRVWQQTVFEEFRKLADPRAGDALRDYLATGPHMHLQTLAAFAMAEVSDLRAVPILAARLRLDEETLFPGDSAYELAQKRNANGRVVATRLIADLAVMHPEQRDTIRAETEDAILGWLRGLPSPHANGMRALAALDSKPGRALIRGWANPTARLPGEGHQPPIPEEWVIVQPALRYVGAMKDGPSWQVLERSLTRRAPKIDATMDGMMHGEIAILGMTLQSIGVGASQGFSEWGDHRAFAPLMRFIEDPKENELSRMEACKALAWVAGPSDAPRLTRALLKYQGAAPRDEFRRACVLETLYRRPGLVDPAVLLGLISPNTSSVSRQFAARALGRAGLDAPSRNALFERMKDPALLREAALALILGGTADVAAKAVAAWPPGSQVSLEELGDLWYKSFGYWSEEDLALGRIFRWVDNAGAIAQVTLGQTAQTWAPTLLRKQFDNLDIDNGPHSLTRVRLRHALLELARRGDPSRRALAVRTLGFMNERGALLALLGEQPAAPQRLSRIVE